MSQFAIKLSNGFYERNFLEKLQLDFKTINSKNILLERKLLIFEDEKDLYAIFNMTPLIPNVPLILGGTGTIFFIFFQNIFLLISASIFLLMSLFWSKYFFYTILKIVMLKKRIKGELI